MADKEKDVLEAVLKEAVDLENIPIEEVFETLRSTKNGEQVLEVSRSSGDSAAYQRSAAFGDDIVIVAAYRTALCKARRGSFKDTLPDDLLAPVLKAVVESAKLNPAEVGDIVVGTVLRPGSQRASECRMAAFYAGFPETVPIRTVNRQCSSVLQAVADVAASIRAVFYEFGIGAGIESMSVNPMSWEGSPNPKNKDVTEAVQQVAAAYDCKIVEGVLSHQLKQFVIDGNKVILSVTSPDTKVDDAEFEENEVYAVDIVASTGDGKPKLLDEKQTTIYKRAVDKSYHLKMKASRFIFSEISQNFPIMPFTARSSDEKRARMGLVECVNHELLQPYPVLHEKPGLSFYTSEKEAADTALKEMNGKIINWWMIMVDVAKTNPPKYSRGSPRPRY